MPPPRSFVPGELSNNPAAGTPYYRKILHGDPCVYCGRKVRRLGYPDRLAASTIDHIRPSSRNGKSNWWNYAACCARCNQRKGNMDVLEFIHSGLFGKRKLTKKQKGHTSKYYAKGDCDIPPPQTQPNIWHHPLFYLLDADYRLYFGTQTKRGLMGNEATDTV